jgi:hypothetical protein
MPVAVAAGYLAELLAPVARAEEEMGVDSHHLLDKQAELILAVGAVALFPRVTAEDPES